MSQVEVSCDELAGVQFLIKTRESQSEKAKFQLEDVNRAVLDAQPPLYTQLGQVSEH